MKTTSIRLDPTTHAQLVVLAQLQGTSITDILQTAIAAHIESLRADPNLVDHADAVLADIDREAADRRAAISTLFGAETTAAPAKPARARKASGEDPT